MSTASFWRNVLLVFGAHAVSYFLAAPLSVPITMAWAGSLTDGSLGAIGEHLVLSAVFGLAAGVAGFILGFALEESDSRWWGVALAVLTATPSFQQHRWRLHGTEMIVGVVLQALISGVLAYLGFLFGRHWRSDNRKRATSGAS